MKKITLIIVALMVLILTGCNFSPDQNPVTSNNETTSGETTETPKIPANCTSWFDGCNNCFAEDGKIGGCTMMYCAPEDTKEPKCLQFKGEENNNETVSVETSGETVIPAGCTSWFDGCNNCFVQDGKIGGCTRMYCDPENTKEPKCLEFKAEENKDDATQPKTNDCVQNGGTWDGEYSECFGVDKTTCESINGQFDECASACRHDPKAEVCTMQCVQVCNVK